jgi:hypothetical protein
MAAHHPIEERPLWVQDYIQGDSAVVVGARYGICSQTIYNHLDSVGIPRRGMRDAKLASLGRNYREDCFDVASPDRDYHVGFIMADGCIADGNGPENPCLQVRIAEVDIEYLRELLRFVGAPEKHISISEPSGPLQRQRSCIVSISSPQMAAALAKFGVVPRKSKRARAIGLESSDRFWAGMVDGDGAIDGGGRTPRLRLCGSQAICRQFAEYVRTIHPEYAGEARKSSTIFATGLSHVAAIAVLRRLYENQYFTLPRKRREALRLVSEWDALWHEERQPEFCTVDGCKRKPLAKGLCTMHYTRVAKHGDPNVDLRTKHLGCSVLGCAGSHRGHGYCGKPVDQAVCQIGLRPLAQAHVVNEASQVTACDELVLQTGRVGLQIGA